MNTPEYKKRRNRFVAPGVSACLSSAPCFQLPYNGLCCGRTARNTYTRTGATATYAQTVQLLSIKTLTDINLVRVPPSEGMQRTHQCGKASRARLIFMNPAT